jgi:Protein of unknown function (DUF2933)
MSGSDEARSMSDQKQAPGWRTRSGGALLCFLAIAGLLLITAHAARVLVALPYLLPAAWLPMHLLMHRSHGGPGRAAAPANPESP